MLQYIVYMLKVVDYVYIYTTNVFKKTDNVFYSFSVPLTPLPKVENVAPSITGSAHSDHSPREQNGFTMSSSSHDAASPPPENNSTAAPSIDKKNKKKLSIGGSFTKFWKGNKKVKDNGMELDIDTFWCIR